MLRQVRSLMAAPTRPWHFLVAVLFYALTWILVSYAFSVLGHRFGWSLWRDPYSVKHTIAVGAFWSVGMVAWNYWRSQKRELS
jgi:hypothetical protein